MALCPHHKEPITGVCARCGDHVCLVCTLQGKRDICYPCVVRRTRERSRAAAEGLGARLFQGAILVLLGAFAGLGAYLGWQGGLSFVEGPIGALLGAPVGIIAGALFVMVFGGFIVSMLPKKRS